MLKEWESRDNNIVIISKNIVDDKLIQEIVKNINSGNFDILSDSCLNNKFYDTMHLHPWKFKMGQNEKVLLSHFVPF